MALAITACADERSASPVLPDGPVRSVAAVDAESETREVTRILALGLSRPEVRAGVRNALRRSPATEHKLVLQDWAATHAGEQVLAATARAAGVDPAALLGRIRGLPRMDFYMPFREHRKSWRATGDVVVASTLDPDAASVGGYATDGTPRTYLRARGVPAQPMLLLHLAEPAARRLKPQADAPGEVIQDPGDGEVGITMIEECDPSAITCNEPTDPCLENPSLPECQYTPPPPPSGTFMEGFWFTPDGDTEWGDEELEFRAKLMHATPPGSYDPSYVEAQKTLRYTGMNPGDNGAHYWDKFDFLFSARITDTSRWIVIALYETDPSPNPDDDMGTHVWSYSDFQAGNGLAEKSYRKQLDCHPYADPTYCWTTMVSADLRVTPWP